MDKEQLSKLNRILDNNKISLEFNFVPFSQSRNRDAEHFTLNWRCELKQNDRPIHGFNYSAGVGYIPGDIRHDRVNKIAGDKIVGAICESGRYERHSRHGESPSWVGVKPWTGVLMPEMTDVLYSLLMDSDVLDYSSFDDWAECLGFDTDSRKAYSIYEECMKTAFALRSAFGEDNMTALSELFSEY